MAGKLIRQNQTDRVFAENAFKTLATNIRYASVDHEIATIVVTSSVANEGKSTVAIGLARALAQSGRRVLLVDCDMRRRSLAGMLGVHSLYGIYAVLSGEATIEDAVLATHTRGLDFLDCEPHIPNPVDVLSSKRFRKLITDLQARYNTVIMDTPPLGAFVDAAVASESADGTVLVARQNFVKREELRSSYDQLRKANANILGIIMNHCENDKSEYYYSYYRQDK